MELTVARKEVVGTSIALLDLSPENGQPLPSWSPGSHIELKLPTDKGELVRQYSLCGPAESRDAWRIAVLREVSGRGGSAYVYDGVEKGQRLSVSGPRNNFAFNPRSQTTFIAGGIGITPILPMVQHAEKLRLDWRLIYLTRSRNRMIFLDQIDALPAARVILHHSGERGRLDLERTLSIQGKGDSIYACGPMRLLDDLETLKSSGNCQWDLHIERFENPNKAAPTGNTSFEVVLAKSGRRVLVSEGDTILKVLQRDGMDVPCSCRDGVCGTCEQRVLEGIPDHRDAVLSPEERKRNSHMMICVSRSLTPSITLDI